MLATIGEGDIFMVGRRFLVENIIFEKSIEPVSIESFPMLIFLPFGKSKSLSRFACALLSYDISLLDDSLNKVSPNYDCLTWCKYWSKFYIDS